MNRQAIPAHGRTGGNVDDERFWLCCGSRHPVTHFQKCFVVQRSYPERMRYGALEEHKRWEKGPSNPPVLRIVR